MAGSISDSNLSRIQSQFSGIEQSPATEKLSKLFTKEGGELKSTDLKPGELSEKLGKIQGKLGPQVTPILLKIMKGKLSDLVVDTLAKDRINVLEGKINEQERKLGIIDGNISGAKYNKGVWKGSEEHRNLESSAQTVGDIGNQELLRLKDQLAQEMNEIDIGSVEQNLGPAEKQVLALMLSFKRE